MDQAAIVRAWPDILDWLSRHKRVTWTLVSASTQPLSFDGSRLILAIETAGLAETFRRGAHPAFVQEALMEVLGIDARVEGVVSGDARDAGRHGGPSQGAITTPVALGGPPAQPDPAPSSSSAEASAPQETTAVPVRRDPASQETPAVPVQHDAAPPSPTPGPIVPASRPRPAASTSDWSSAPPPSSSAPSWATGGEDPIERAPTEPHATVDLDRSDPVAPPPRTVERAVEVVDDPASISDDDEDIETSGEVGQAVVERLLGGTVINEADD